MEMPKTDSDIKNLKSDVLNLETEIKRVDFNWWVLLCYAIYIHYTLLQLPGSTN
jgi:hypothetical protein